MKIWILLAIRVFVYRIFFRPFLSIIVGIKFPKASLFPEKQFILVCNHNSHLDTVSLLCSIPIKRLLDVHPAAAADYFAKNKLMAFLCEVFLNTVFVRRKGEAGSKPIDDLDQHIKSGKSLILFPEGTRGLPEELASFKNGVAILLQRNPSILIIPIFMKGMGKAMPKGDAIIVPMECEIHVGEPLIDPNAAAKPVTEVTEEIRKAILKLSGKKDE